MAADSKQFVIDSRTLAGHTAGETFNVTPISAVDLGDKVAKAFSLTDLESAFVEYLCPDYDNHITIDSRSQALAFAYHVIYDIGPKSRGVKDKSWLLNFPFNGETRTAHVITLKTPNDELANNPNTLTIKRATLLAMKPFNEAAVAIYNQNKKVVLTPLAAATFSVENIEEIAKVIKKTPQETIASINASTCNGGYLLDNSNAACAILAALSATASKEAELRKSIVSKVVKQYASHHKVTGDTLASMSSLCQFATGGVPIGFEEEALRKIFEIEKTKAISAREAAKMVKEKKVSVAKMTTKPSTLV